MRKPSRFIGRFFAGMMNESHSALTDWGLTHVTIEPHFTILDVGCGGGRTIQKLATTTPQGKVFGIDYAAGSVATSRRKNRKLIDTGRVNVQRASVSQLPFPDNNFDLVTAVETQYYWPNLPGDMREILRVLKPGGTLLVIAETYKGSKYDIIQRPIMWLLRSTQLSKDDHRTLFETAGFTNVQVVEEPKEGWISAFGGKPSIRVEGAD